MSTLRDAALAHVLSSVSQLEDLVGEPSELVVTKVGNVVTPAVRAFLDEARFMLLATSGADGTCDVSPRGDARGAVLHLDDRTIAIADRPGNRRVDNFRNVLGNPHVGLLFVVPGASHTVRVNGRASLTVSPEVLDLLEGAEARPKLALVVEIDEIFAHCPKAFQRSGLWDSDQWVDQESVPTSREMTIELKASRQVVSV
ncbi:MSMEG_1061 family FMN-dependent PPOX-type flavoprotein [Rhodococcoides yunnanense]|uniref:MSMEG_1061 family FMN-dependent PPOX-type flavoprotein n=1 Tax=Rhodococcoides yunnanense TaxID=278209 RepID=UPI000934761C|nr:MSMEG_1061 family FMN-dependent PPOX-type flavoprotein [Rhodococcus yunnanensis]